MCNFKLTRFSRSGLPEAPELQLRRSVIWFALAGEGWEKKTLHVDKTWKMVRNMNWNSLLDNRVANNIHN